LGTVSSTATKIDSRNIRIKDVTTQFIDTKTRLDNKLQLLEKRYLNLLDTAPGKMPGLSFQLRPKTKQAFSLRAIITNKIILLS
jgi:hypothetical protein